MARPGVTYQHIVTAVNELKGQGKNVTIENVRGILGTGSIGTINNHLRKWKEAQQAILHVASKEQLPDSLVALIKGLWEGVVAQATAQFMPIEENYKQDLAALREEGEKYKNNNQRWQKMFHQWQQEKTTLVNKQLTLEQALELAQKESAALHAKQDGLYQQVQEKQERIDELHRLHQQTQHNLEHYREAAREQRLLDQEQFEREKQQLLVEIKSLKSEIVTQRQHATDLQQKNVALVESKQFLESSYAQCQNDNKQLTMECKAAEKKCHEYLVSYQTYQNHNKQLLETVQEQANRLVDYQAENKMLTNNLAKTTNELEHVTAQWHLVAREKKELIQRKVSHNKVNADAVITDER